MLEKRLPALVWGAAAAALCLSLYRLLGWPAGGLGDAPPTRPPQPAYLLLLPGNATASAPPYPLARLPAGDAAALIDLRGFRFLINNYPCGEPAAAALGPGAANASTPQQQQQQSSPSASWGGGGPWAAERAPLLLVLVHSAPDNAEKRATIRATWGGAAARAGADFRVLFLLGDVGGGERQARLDAENRRHGDLVQGNFRDSYRNMTYKHVMALKWAAYHCPGARYLLKADDDVFVNAPALLSFLARALSPWGARRLILCAPFPYAYVKRSWRSKWRVSPLEYPGRVYPAYCAGWAVLYSPDVVFLLYEQAQAGPYFWIDDVHVTGTLAARANLTHTPLGSLVLSEAQVAAVLAGEPPPQFLFGAPNMSLDAIRRLWRVVSRAHAGAAPAPATDAADGGDHS
ncbi:beta-1,3-galactosyltransferase 4-like [Schistocerca gregaria]|uniref:beta-1,3-galactosyltransferase 4-like n=1 Tax=Schistocerca gregaria TaxID=7010 RepID=UPI00211DD5CA|nr:beta-1,3-galactosyltransferase 4-like [Schistocerca gregaria]